MLLLNILYCFTRLLDANNNCKLQPKEQHNVNDDFSFCEPQLFNVENRAWGTVLFRNSDIWGPNPTWFLNDDTLEIRAEIKYVPLEETDFNGTQTIEPLTRRLRQLYDTDVGKDFTIVSSAEEERQVHRAVLAISSPVLKAMIDSDLEETETGRCEMPDISTETLDTLVRFMYYNSTKDLESKQHARDVLVAADKYQMNDLKETCERILAADLKNENAIELLLLADKVTAKFLKNSALRHVAVNFRVMENAGQLKKIGEDSDKDQVQEIFRAVARWGVNCK